MQYALFKYSLYYIIFVSFFLIDTLTLALFILFLLYLLVFLSLYPALTITIVYTVLSVNEYTPVEK